MRWLCLPGATLQSLFRVIAFPADPPRTRMTPTAKTTPPLDLDAISAQLQDAQAADIVAWADRQFGQGLVLTSSFGAQAAVMLHLATQVIPQVPVILIDTGYLFPETYRFAEELTQRLKLNLKVYNPAMTP